MRVVVQRVSHASVTIDGEVVGQIGRGLLVLVGINKTDGEAEITFLADKLVNLRIFPDDDDKMNRSLMDIGGELLVVSQFTLYGDCRKGRRPSFIDAAGPDHAIPVYERFVARIRESGLNVETGRFGANMQVDLQNDGPVTLIIDSPDG
ncbi:D-tyrosyl-tRNA(Tyr) deacylase [bacterium]|nr:D-tyrosyl-tRNA(Tyr) deacylase [bacterium]